MTGRIVVGIDGSDHARRALQHAVEEAQRRGARLDVVHTYQIPIYWGPAGYGAPIPGVSTEEAERAAHEVIDQCLGHEVPADVEVERIVTHGPPAQALLEVAEGADLLVVGSRGLGGFRGLLLGSTSQQVITHAPCPVLVVRPTVGDDVDRDAA